MIFDNELDQAFGNLFSQPEGIPERVPPSMKARLYTTLVRAQQADGALASLNSSVAAGHGVCVFEKLVQIAPVGDTAKSPFFCSICHARLLGETFDQPPIYWHNCPYVQFKRS
jgi:hypothetical protein